MCVLLAYGMRQWWHIVGRVGCPMAGVRSLGAEQNPSLVLDGYFDDKARLGATSCMEQ